MASILPKIKTYDFSNKADYIITKQRNANELINNAPVDLETIAFDGSIIQLAQTRLDEYDTARTLAPTAITSNDASPTDLPNIIDGDPNTFGVIHHTIEPAYITLDLGSIVQVRRIILKHIYQAQVTKKYKSVAIKISTDNITYVTLYNNNKVDYTSVGLEIGNDNEYAETPNGLVIDLNNLDCQYIRVYGFGSNLSALQTEFRNLEIYKALYWNIGGLETKETLILNQKHSSLPFFTETDPIIIGSQAIRYNVIVEGIKKFFDGYEWMDSDNTYYQANTIAEINANIDALFNIRQKHTTAYYIWLKSNDDGLSSPTLDALTVSAELDSSYLPNKCEVYCYLSDIGLHVPNDDDVEAEFRVDVMNYLNNGNVITAKSIKVKPFNGVIRQHLVPNDTSIPSDKKYLFTVRYLGKVVFEKYILVPNTTKQNITDILV